MLKKMKVGTRLYLLVGFMSLLLAGVGILGLESAKHSNESLDTVYRDRVVPLEGLKVISDMYAVNIVDTSHKVRDGVLTWEEGRKHVDEAVQTIAAKWKQYLGTFLVAEERKLTEEIAPLMKEADAAVSKLGVILKGQDRSELARFAARELYPAIDPVSEKFGKLVDVQLKVAKAEFDKSDREYHHNRMLALLSIVFGVGLAVLVSVFLIRNLTRQLGGEPWYLAGIAQAVAQGDLSAEIDTAGRHDESVVVAMKKMVSNVKALAEDSNTLAQAAVAGKLSTRADPARHQGEYRSIVEGVNRTLDSVIGPLNVAAEYVDRIRKGKSRPVSPTATTATSTRSS